ncbi:MAG: hypothetical protein ACYC8T_38660 [Myxococcaceae bacterium]
MAPLALGLLLALLAPGCKQTPDGPVCGLHSAAAPVFVLVGKDKRALTVGSRLSPNDRIAATGPALLECFGGALRVLEDGDEVKIGKLVEAEVVGGNLPEQALRDGELVELPWSKRIVAARYVSTSFTPLSVSAGQSGSTTADYLKAFFTPNGIANMQNEPVPDGPRKLPAPPNRPRVPHIHAAELGAGGVLALIEDEFAFAETDDLATAVLLEGRTIELGRTVRLVLPKGAEVTLSLPGGKEVSLEGPADLRLR